MKVKTLIVLSALISMPVLADNDEVSAGKKLFSLYCESCHGPDGNGNGAAAEDMMLKPRDFALAAFKFDTDADWERGTDADIGNVIKEGAAVYGGSALMPMWSQSNDDEISGLIAYIRSLEK